MEGLPKVNRPISPHLTIYKPQLTSVLSIMHRITGIGLVMSLLLVIVWFAALSMGANAFAFVDNIFNSILIQVLLLSSVWALCYHTCTGIRHLIWDLGYGLAVKWIAPSAYVVLLGSICLFVCVVYVGGAI